MLFLFERSNRRGGGFFFSGGGFFQTKHIDIVPGRSSRARPGVPGGVLELNRPTQTWCQVFLTARERGHRF